jgi:hypothetical protein
MIISNGIVTNQLILYPPAQPYHELDQTIWPTLDEEDNNALQTLMTIEHSPLLDVQDEDKLIVHIIQNDYGKHL